MAPFWRELSRREAEIAPDVRICPRAARRARRVQPGLVRGTRRRNKPDRSTTDLDPSHFWWQGIDQVAVVEALGDRIGFAPATDTHVKPRPRPPWRASSEPPGGSARPRRQQLTLLSHRRRARRRHLDGTAGRRAAPPVTTAPSRSTRGSRLRHGAEGIEHSLAGLRRALGGPGVNTSRLGVALIGTGGRARRTSQAHARVRARRAARHCCNMVPGAAAAVAPDGVAADTELAQTLAARRVRAVVVAASTTGTPPSSRRQRAGTPRAVREAAHARARGRPRLDALARARGSPAGRLHPAPRLACREALRLIEAGAIGAPRMARLAQWDAAAPPAEFLDPAISGGLEIDCGIHEVDTGAWLLARRSTASSPSAPRPATNRGGRRPRGRGGAGHDARRPRDDDRPAPHVRLRRHRPHRDRRLRRRDPDPFEERGELSSATRALRLVPGPPGEAVQGTSPRSSTRSRWPSRASPPSRLPTTRRGRCRAARAMRDARIAGGWISLR